MPDPNMNTAYHWARQLGRVPRWYKSKDFQIHDVATLVNMLDKPIVRNSLLNDLTEDKATIQMRNVLNVILRWWSGCLSMAKTIAFETRDGPVTPKKRKINSLSIRRKALRDRVFADGVRAAPTFRTLRKQAYSLEGIDEKVLRELVNEVDIKIWKKARNPKFLKTVMGGLSLGMGYHIGAQLAKQAMEDAKKKKFPPIKIPKEFANTKTKTKTKTKIPRTKGIKANKKKK